MASAAVELTPVNSSLFSGVRYDDEHWTLTVRFKSNGSALCYQQVPPEVGDEFLSAESMGKFYSSRIKGRYEALPVSDLISPPPASGEPEAFADAGFITDADIRRVDPDYQPKSQPEINRPGHPVSVTETVVVEAKIDPSSVVIGVSEPHTPATDMGHVTLKAPTPSPVADLDAQAAIALPQEKAPEINSIVEQGKKHAAEAMQVRVQDAMSYAAAAQMLKILQSARERAFSFLDPIREAIYRAYQVAQKKQKEALDPIDTAITHVKRAMASWQMEEERKRREALAAEQRRADEAARLLQAQQSQQLTMAEVGDALESGDTERAEALIANPIEAPRPYVAPAYVAPTVPKVEGIASRENWKVAKEELDVAKLLQAVKDGKIEVARAAALVEFNVPALNKMAKAMKSAFDIPGARAFNDAVIASRK